LFTSVDQVHLPINSNLVAAPLEPERPKSKFSMTLGFKFILSNLGFLFILFCCEFETSKASFLFFTYSPKILVDVPSASLAINIRKRPREEDETDEEEPQTISTNPIPVIQISSPLPNQLTHGDLQDVLFGDYIAGYVIHYSQNKLILDNLNLMFYLGWSKRHIWR